VPLAQCGWITVNTSCSPMPMSNTLGHRQGNTSEIWPDSSPLTCPLNWNHQTLTLNATGDNNHKCLLFSRFVYRAISWLGATDHVPIQRYEETVVCSILFDNRFMSSRFCLMFGISDPIPYKTKVFWQLRRRRNINRLHLYGRSLGENSTVQYLMAGWMYDLHLPVTHMNQSEAS